MHLAVPGCGTSLATANSPPVTLWKPLSPVVCQIFSTRYRDPMSTEGTARRLALVHAAHSAAAAAPEGVEADGFAWACLADCYEVAADLVEVESGIAGPPQVAELLWPGAWHLPDGLGVLELAQRVAGRADELVVLTADAPDSRVWCWPRCFRCCTGSTWWSRRSATEVAAWPSAWLYRCGTG